MGSVHKSSRLRESLIQADLKLFVRDVRDPQGRKLPVTVRSWSTIKDVKDLLQRQLHVPPSAQKLYFGPLMTSGGELPNHRSLHDAGIYRSGETLLLDISRVSRSPAGSRVRGSQGSEEESDIIISSSVIDAAPRVLRRLVQQARRGFSLGLKPHLVLEGSGGTYFLHDARKVRVGVFKPADEEPYAENNPRGYVREISVTSSDISLRAGIEPGEACLREVAAYMLDHGGFSCVPMTTLVEARHRGFHTNGTRLNITQGGASLGAHSLNPLSPASSPIRKKVGSFQAYVKSECSMDDMSPTLISTDEVHKIAILDIRLMNADRNPANLLCHRREDNSLELIPIDHGYCLRSVCDVCWFDWCWLDWPQVKKPLSQRSKDYVLSLDVNADVQLLEERLNISKLGLDYFRASTKLLQAGVRAGLTLYDIAVLCCRNDNAGDIPSRIEGLYRISVELATAAVENGRWHHAAASSALEKQLLPDGPSFTPSKTKASIYSMIKSASSTDFPSYMNSLSHSRFETSTPNMIVSSVSSGSDTGSDNDEDEDLDRGECDAWAASVIADVKEPEMVDTERSQSSGSLCSSETALSSSPKGFWHFHPSSQDIVDDSSWSPVNSPRIEGVVGFEQRRFDPPDIGISLNSSTLLPPPASLDAPSSNKVSFRLVGDTEPTSRIGRSQSYSAVMFRNLSRSEISFEEELAGEYDDDSFRPYLLKFVDLLIEREIASAKRKLNTEKNAVSTSTTRPIPVA
eukprot:CAMPEP_0118700904 /NCGR_PEP_ID=MMETSP0800-20121206/16887_1 /TAXON_ID=210618 ORGANISM="Striatella unipunctata, Strain CCMP2910" /NCGR_SAMPLE_ID=MMETSP0800 /ASSEMBLY_ACC=CAM_ASM_000638 /LENGTH=743 /DNA_ID=CAMNT_0006601631 /DNA_START=282 /DNA_END=2513 /DNA_ORIENTATION=+